MCLKECEESMSTTEQKILGIEVFQDLQSQHNGGQSVPHILVTIQSYQLMTMQNILGHLHHHCRNRFKRKIIK